MTPVADNRGILPGYPDTGIFKGELMQGEDRKEPVEQVHFAEPAKAVDLHKVRHQQRVKRLPVFPEPCICTGMLPHDEDFFELFRIPLHYGSPRMIARSFISRHPPA
jgi:hypothetical protein